MTQQLPVITVLCPDDGLRPRGMNVLTGRAEIRYTNTEELAASLQGAEVLFLWDFFSDAVEEAWHSAAELRWIHVAAAGVDKMLFDELTESGVVVTNAQGVFDRPIAEFVLGAVIAEAKQFRLSQQLQAEGVWRHRETRRVEGSAAMVIGTGAIGREAARLLKALDVEVRGVGRTAREGDEDFGQVVASSDLAQHVEWADYLINAAPLTPQTTGLIDKQVLEAMKPGSTLINIGRGETVDEPALVHALQNGPLASAWLDVFAVEPLPEESRLWELPNVSISPHMSGDVEGWRDALADQFVANAQRWLENRELSNVVDKEKGYVPRT